MDLKLDALLNEASRRADGLSDFGDERFRAPAQVLLDAMNREGGLSAAGRQIWHSRLVELLRNRLLMEQFFKLHPEIEDEEIGGPIVIVGLPRTGTTLLQRILGCDRRFHSMLYWETRFPQLKPLQRGGQAWLADHARRAHDAHAQMRRDRRQAIDKEGRGAARIRPQP